MILEIGKTCSKCRGVFDLEEGFHKDRTKKGGFRNECKECCKKYRKKFLNSLKVIGYKNIRVFTYYEKR